MDRIKQLTTAALSVTDSIRSPVLYEAVELLVDAINELADEIESLRCVDEEAYGISPYGDAEITE